MPDPSPSPPSTFAPAAQRVLVRVWLRRWLALLAKSLWWVSGLVACLLIIGALMGKMTLLTVLVWLILIAWLAGPLIVIWRRKPNPYGALALWDQVTNRREAFASAWWFEQQQQLQTVPLTNAQQFHIEAQRVLLTDALTGLNNDLPLRPHRWLGLPPLLVAAMLLITALIPRHDGVVLMDDAMKQQALQEAAKLAQTEWDKKKLEGLKADEKKDLEKLKENLKQTAQNLEKAGGKDAREVMADLERRAREAEKLAERLGVDKGDWASEKLTKSLRQHADTADLGDAVAAKNSTQAAVAADKLAKVLKSPQLTHDAQERLNETLKDSQKAAEKEDSKRMVGQPVLTAGDQLQQEKAGAAGDQFEKLADQMRDLARREQTRKELEKLAQQLRDSGSNIAGQNGAGSMQQMAAAGQQGQQNQSGQSAPQVGQAQAQQGQMGQNQQSLQPPGLSQMTPGQTPPQMMNPVPGTGQPQQMTMAQGQPQQGKQGQAQGQPMLLAPIPGAKPGDQPSALLLGPPGESPSEGPAIGIAMPGGKEPGNGTAKLDADATKATKSGNQAVVTAQQNTQGQSTVRAVEGGTRKEQATRSASQVAVDFIQTEEEALDESALPPSRREQVRRYFTELRKRFEKQP